MRTTDAGIASLLRAAKALDQVRLRRALDACAEQLGLEGCIARVMFPFLRAVGDAWEAGEIDVAHEHAASDVVNGWLDAQRVAHPPTRAGRVLIVCGPLDDHAFGAGCLATLLAARGRETWFFGHPTPPDALAVAIEHLSPQVVVVVSHLPENRHAALRSLEAAGRFPGVRLAFAGRAFDDPTRRSGVPGAYLGLDLAAAADLVETMLSHEG